MKLTQLSKIGVIGLLLILTACTGVPKGITPVNNFDLLRYQGTWYEIARLDHRFERGMQNVTATYTLNEDGSVAVINRGYVTDTSTWKQAKGVAKFVSSQDIGHLKVSFWGPFYGSYIVFKLDHAHYQYAYVTSYDREYLWLLSRTPHVPQRVLEDFKKTAKDSGYAIDELIFMQHEDV
ncbi:lipocalin family protein [Pseudoalteromonas luteoviolacea]|uniref:lipocalin family protein n=1 Tax=Pseudoalteromonas luteoviolacea TaxID=43657 RepID=UPI001FFD6DE1|nr:lipocalin family protein [Pseudoalteromonas luteoviolacea]